MTVSRKATFTSSDSLAQAPEPTARQHIVSRFTRRDSRADI
jgi:hypothetical protein